MTAQFTTIATLLTAGVSLWAFQFSRLKDRLLFRPEDILARKEWHRLLSSSLIHANGPHLIFNLMGLFSFGSVIERHWGAAVFLGIYVGSVLGGSLLSLYLHRFHDYSALGASGGVCGVIFSCIFLVPGTAVSLMFLPGIPGPIFALAYLVGTFVALRKGGGNIGHDAHFGGAITGLALAALIAPQNCLDAPLLFGLCFAVAVFCLWVLARDPMGISGKVLPLGKPEHRPHIRYQHYDEVEEKRKLREETDRILDKISEKGFQSLTEKEKALLDKASAGRRR